ncbi:MAG: HPr kinase/phosphatase C-terminal domain-containing protein [Rhodobacteraceae bacterium]|jgi:HPr kinase/phosphorylase|nr:HPr kinase/phosphatase C-terminal domain-containing protein [Paracoccaceae bacterium]
MVPGPQVLHATAVALEGRALLILGPSGSGKSALALQLMALGARLVSDDRTTVTLGDGHPVASAPTAILGRIEARGIGILAAEPAPPCPVALVADLAHAETERLPPPRQFDLLGIPIPLVHRIDSPHFPAALVQYLRGGIVP